MDKKITIFYSKSTGDIKAFCSGEQDMSFFSSNKDDLSIIWDYIVLENDNNIQNNLMFDKSQFYVDAEKKELNRRE